MSDFYRDIYVHLLDYPKDWNAAQVLSYRWQEGGVIDLDVLANKLGFADKTCKVCTRKVFVTLDVKSSSIGSRSEEQQTVLSVFAGGSRSRRCRKYAEG